MRIPRREVLSAALAVLARFPPAFADTLADDAVEQILRERVDVARQSVGIVAGVLHGAERRIVAYGRSDAANGRPLDGDSVFEIGSITKVFTALLLADMVVRSEVALDDPVAKYLPAAVKMPARNGKQITLLDLATYSSGLPREPGNLPRKDEATPLEHFDPFAGYTVENLYAFLSGYTLNYDPGTHYEYANLGFGLLGHALSLRAGKTYEDLVLARICAPLGMESTRIALSPSMRERLTQGHTPILEPTANWDLGALPGAGALCSTANDLFAFLEAAAGVRPNAQLAPAFDLLLKTRRPHGSPNTKSALGWFVTTEHDDEIVHKDGETGGYTTFIGFSTWSRQASIVLSNAGFNLVDDIGRHLVNPAFPIDQYPPQVAVDPAILATYAGTYARTANYTLTIRADGARLFVRGTGHMEFELFADDADRFFMRSDDAQAIFLRGADGQVRQMIWHQNGGYRYYHRMK